MCPRFFLPHTNSIETIETTETTETTEAKGIEGARKEGGCIRG